MASNVIGKVKSWDSHNINDGLDYAAAFNISTGLPGLTPAMTAVNNGAPIISNIAFNQRVLPPLEITILDETDASLRTQLHQWFDNKANETKVLVVTDLDGTSTPRYIEAVCVGLQQKAGVAGIIYVVALVQDGLKDKHYRWRKVTADTDSWNITASGQTKTIANGGHDETYPILTITPTSASSGGYAYKVWVPVRWRTSEAFTRYPFDLTDDAWDTAALISGAKMQADGDDLRVEVNGSQVNRWLDGINTTTTKVWVNLNFAAKVELTTTAAIAGTGSVDTIDFNEATTSLPSSGIMMIDSEAFVYTGKNDSLKRITGVTRASRSTSMAAHGLGATAWWVQNDIYILYGNSSVSAPTVDDNYKPIFNIATSTNTSWVYSEFGEDDGLRSGSWQFNNGYRGVQYTDNHYGTTDPWDELGIYIPYNNLGVACQMFLYNPCGITAANFTNGEKYAGFAFQWFGYVRSSNDGVSFNINYTIPKPSVSDTWESWSQNVTGISSQSYIILTLGGPGSYSVVTETYLEADDCTLTIDSNYTPTASLLPESGNYSLECTITNNTTGDAITIDFTMELNESLEINTDEKTVIYLLDNSSQLQARELVGGVRLEWLPLAVGNNELEYTAVSTGNITVGLEWEERLYY